MKQVEWQTSTIHELDLTSTELSTETLEDVLCRMPGFIYLAVGYCEFFNDKVRSPSSKRRAAKIDSRAQSALQ